MMDKELLVKLVSLVFTTILYLPFKTSAFGYKDALTMAKRGQPGDPQLKFRGTPFPEVTYASIHDNIFLECEVGGIPSPTIHWLKNGERIQQGVTRDYMDDEAAFEERENPEGQPMLRLGKVKSRLYLDCVTDRDVAKYTCVAETPLARIAQSTLLEIGSNLSPNVQEKCITKKAFRGEPARIHMWTAVRLEYEGAPVQLFCRADGYPAPVCNWRFSEMGTPIKSDQKHSILPNGDLLIHSVNWAENMGLYFCRCENEAGLDEVYTDEVSTFLYPTSP